MASDDSITNEVQKQELHDSTTCCICADVFTDPKLLPCMHTFCMICIQETGLKTNKGPGDEMPCPICRRLFKIPAEGFKELSSNSYIEKLIQVGNLLEHSALSKDVCDACLEDNEGDDREQIPMAESYCVECRQKLCEECCRHHRKVKLTKNHELMPMMELQKSLFGESVMSNLTPSVCEPHERRVLDIYCVKCDAVVCAICFIEDHKNHEGSHVNKFLSDFKQQIATHSESTNECSSKAHLMKSKLLKLKDDMQQKVESLESEVLNRKNDLKEMLDAHAHSILQNLGLLQRNKLKEIQVAVDEIDAHLSGLDSFETRCQVALEKGSPCHICKSVSNLSARAIQLQQQSVSLVEQEIKAFTVCFKKSELEEFLQREGGNLIGEIEEERDTESKENSKRDKPTYKALEAEIEKIRQELNNEKESNKSLQDDLDKLQQEIVAVKWSAKEELKKMKTAELLYKSDPVLVHRIGTRAVEEEKTTISGLAILDNDLFIVSRGSSEVEVYELKKFTFSRRWNLEELNDPTDMGSCKINKCLYIIDYTRKSLVSTCEILRIDLNGRLINKWSTGHAIAVSLSVTDESNVILTVNCDNKLNKYSPDGKLLRVIDLSSVEGIRFVNSAIEMYNGDFLVCNGQDSDELHRVCIVDAIGNLKKSFGGKPGKSLGQVNAPVHVSVDVNGCVMVVDFKNSRVLLLDSDLQYKREILSMKRHGLRSPYGIFLDYTNGRLIVVDSDLKSMNKLCRDGPRPISIFAFEGY